ncbi:latrophilin Cirl-like isoform X2 [Tigriopus californicus]|nr:latrophilin Cirl-like isoform X2 [Tigriopus californicus]
MAPRTTRIMQSRCDGKRLCEMSVNSDIFGDPCPGTHKYMEVHYACSPKFITTTKRPFPPWFLESGAGDLWSPQKQSSTLQETNPTMTSSTSLKTSSSTLVSSSSIASSSSSFSTLAEDHLTTSSPRKPILVTQPTTPVRIPITTPKATTTIVPTSQPPVKINASITSTKSDALEEYDDNDAESPSKPSSSKHLQTTSEAKEEEPLLPEVEVFVSDLPSPLHPPDHCPPKLARHIHWNWTAGGEVAIVPCPRGSTGLARWPCQSGGQWVGVVPDLSDCKSNAMTNLESRVREEDPENVIVSALAKLTRTSLYGGDLETASVIMRTMANRLQYLLQSQSSSFYKKEAYIQEVFQNILRSASNLVARHQTPAWQDLPASKRSKMVTDILLSLEENAFLLADVTLEEQVLEEASEEIVMAISVINSKKLDASDSSPLSFPDSKFAKIATKVKDRASLPRGNLKRHSNSYELSKAVFFSYLNLHQILQSPVSFNGFDDYKVNSRVLSASLAKGRHVELAQPMVLTFRHLNTNLTGPVCVFWDFEMNVWSNNGCSVKSSDTSQTECECDHLTNFALLMRDGPALSNNGLSTFFWIQILVYIFLVILVIVAVFVAVKFRTQLSHVVRKYFTKSQEKKLQKGLDVNPGSGPGLGPCPKSQSFYSGVNLVTTAVNNQLVNGKAQTLALEKNLRLSHYLHSLPNGNGSNHHHLHAQASDLPDPAAHTATLRMGSQTNANANPLPTYSVYQIEDGMEATKHLRDTVYMSPQLVNLTNTLRSKKRCQAGHCQQQSPHHHHPQHHLQGVNDDSMLPESEVIFRAVSPHGHVYWEIDPKRDHSDEDQPQLSSNSDMSSSRQSSSRYSDNHPLIKGDSPQQPNHQVLVNPFADVQLLPNSVCSSPTSLGQRGSSDIRFSSLRLGKGHLPSFRTPTFRSGRNNKAGISNVNANIREEEIPEQVQIRDLRSIPVSIKSNDYILAKIQSHMNRGSPVDLVVSSNSPSRGGGYHTTAQLDGSKKQRRV